MLNNNVDKTISNGQLTGLKSVWHSPTISRIEIKRTMNGSPAVNDLNTGDVPTP